ncbi:maleylpyruvate isomerase family mycothiol-dependent enzyme [Solicola gregarius]|uniref:Maleylpyruvate isomerase family mycothiol-dependent enzyme n=1 Tax=Solicola gregarius TaxID=2908642 RepID=A0AA46YLM2_9ACTN|nr:maleylpyruvate isomerase family mycothiol-dependent enzyme [Solicola gregarius]UYM07095.1 maleylpyruvate isomerase family mycothiol-dependent enzyme [Solicola gregarius]
MDVMALARQERSELADFLEDLTADEWEVASLCSRWRVRDVVAHAISYEEHDKGDLLRRFVRARFRFGNLNDVALAEYADLDPHQLIAYLRAHLDPQGATARFGGRVGLVDALIHQQDIRRPLGKTRVIPEERLQYALPFAVTAPPLRGFWNARGVRLIADDLDWSYGKGPEAHGPAEAVLMVLAGRAGVARDLAGPGADVLQQRLG